MKNKGFLALSLKVISRVEPSTLGKNSEKPLEINEISFLGTKRSVLLIPFCLKGLLQIPFCLKGLLQTEKGYYKFLFA